jgi:hypothetical protein
MRCRRTPRHVLPGPGDVRGPEDALAVIHAALGGGGGTAALLLDRSGGDGSVVVVAGADDADLEQLVPLLLDGSAGSPFTEIVLATTRPGSLAEVSLDDINPWFSQEARAADAGVVVLDWFILAGDLARSTAETAFSADRW